MKKSVSYTAIGVIAGLSLFLFYNEFGSKFRGEKDVAQNTKQELDLSVYQSAVFSGGCFWCTEADFEKTDGVIEAISGYTGGTTVDPTYEESNTGTTGHREAVKVYYDPAIVDFAQLLEVYWRHHDPRDAGGSFGDRGPQYGSAVYYTDSEQKRIITQSRDAMEALGTLDDPIVSVIEEQKEFYVAEDYHQDYYLKNASRYKLYRGASGRDKYIQEVWGNSLEKAQKHAGGNQAKKDLQKELQKNLSKNDSKKNEYYTSGRDEILFPINYENFTRPSDEILQQKLTDIQYDVTRHEGTERPFHNPYWDQKKDGIYVDIISGEPLYSSTEKYDSGTGWPSFYKPITQSAVTEHDDYKLMVKRTEIRSAIADNHIGHIILDGPAWNDNVRHCMNSAALRFVAVSDMQEQGYGEYLSLFEDDEKF